MVQLDQLEVKLLKEMQAAFVLLDIDEDGITGVVVADSLGPFDYYERQQRIDAAFSRVASDKEREQSRMIIGLTQMEHEASGPTIRVHRITSGPSGDIEVFLRGCLSDARYVADTLRLGKRVEVDPPLESPGAPGMWTVLARRSGVDPLSVVLAQEMLERDENIRVMPGAAREH